MSPEVLRGEGHDFASDIWSLGCLLYEMAVLKSPFAAKGLTMDKLFQRIVEGEYTPVGVGVYDGKLDNLVKDMIQLQPKVRPTIDTVASAALLARTSASLLSSGGLDCLELNGEESDAGEEESEDADGSSIEELEESCTQSPDKDEQCRCSSPELPIKKVIMSSPFSLDSHYNTLHLQPSKSASTTTSNSCCCSSSSSSSSNNGTAAAVQPSSLAPSSVRRAMNRPVPIRKNNYLQDNTDLQSISPENSVGPATSNSPLNPPPPLLVHASSMPQLISVPFLSPVHKVKNRAGKKIAGATAVQFTLDDLRLMDNLLTEEEPSAIIQNFSNKPNIPRGAKTVTIMENALDDPLPPLGDNIVKSKDDFEAGRAQRSGFLRRLKGVIMRGRGGGTPVKKMKLSKLTRVEGAE